MNQIEQSGDRRGVELAGLRARHVDQFLDGLDVQRFRNREDHERVAYARRRDQGLRIVRQLVMQIGMAGECGCRGEQQRVIVIGLEERRDRDDAVAAGLVLDHHGFAPACRETVREQSGDGVGPAAGAERQDQFHRAGRPRLTLRGGRLKQSHQAQQDRESENRSAHGAFFL